MIRLHIHLLLIWLLCQILLQAPTASGQIRMKKGAPQVLLSSPKQLLIGTVHSSRADRLYNAFMGIRYANPARRFELPEPLDEPLDVVRDASKFGSSCARWGRLWKKFVGAEDCLFLNVYVPMKNVAEFLPLPVMLYIHGGSFIDGESDTTGPDFFMDQNVILITINYRLGAFGFLSTGDSVVPGNIGLHDQHLAIKWVHDNIADFGGDTERVTLFGESAGAASVGLQLLYPPNTGLFTHAISQSGSIHCPWVIQSPKHAKSNLYQLSKLVNCSDKRNSSIDLVKCLQSKTFEVILEAQKKIGNWFPGSSIPFAPVVELIGPETGNKRTFLTQSPEVLMEKGQFIKVPHILGINKEEGHFIYSALVLKSQQLTEELNNEWNRIAPLTFLYETRLKDASNLDKVSSKIRDFYLGSKEVDVHSRHELTQLYSDVYFNYGVQKTARAMAAHGVKVYTYIFMYQGEHTLLHTWIGLPEMNVVSHADELQYLFKSNKFGSVKGHAKGSESENISKNMVQLWTSFAASGSPRSTWGNALNWYPLSTENDNDFFWYGLDLDTSIVEEFDQVRHGFWDELTRKYFVDLSGSNPEGSKVKVEL